MRRHRRLGVLFGLLAFLGLCAAVLWSPLSPSTRFAGLPGIEDNITENAQVAVDGIEGVIIDADGRDLTVTLPERLPAGMSKAAITERLLADDGIRSLTVDGGLTESVPEPDAPDPVPTATPQPEPEAEPTAEPEPAPEPTEAPEPEPEPTEVPEPEPEPAPTEVPEPEPDPTLEPLPVDPNAVLAALEVGEIRFSPGSAALTGGDIAVLDGVADVFADLLRGVPVQVQAHTDDQGDPDVNLLLSQDRAQAVTDYLIDRGIDASLLTPRGYGASQPIADNSTEQGRAANSRVAFVVEGN